MADRNAMVDEADVAAPARAGLAGALARRWPTALALLVSAPGFADAPSPGGTAALAQAMIGVARSGAEWCAVVDIMIAAQMVVLPLVM